MIEPHDLDAIIIKTTVTNHCECSELGSACQRPATETMLLHSINPSSKYEKTVCELHARLLRNGQNGIEIRNETYPIEIKN